MTKRQAPARPAAVMPAIGGSRTLAEAERLAEEIANPRPAVAPEPAGENAAAEPAGDEAQG